MIIELTAAAALAWFLVAVIVGAGWTLGVFLMGALLSVFRRGP